MAVKIRQAVIWRGEVDDVLPQEVIRDPDPVGVDVVEREHAGCVGLERRIKYGAYAERKVHCCASSWLDKAVKIAQACRV